MNDQRPELPRLVVGDIVNVMTRDNRGHPNPPLRATITEAKRIWLTLTEIIDGERSRARTWRMRRDDQGDDSQIGYRDRFATDEQLAWEARQTAATDFLKEALGKDTVYSMRRGRYYGDEVTLANLIRAHEGLPPI